jgi:hypothetical protein
VKSHLAFNVPRALHRRDEFTPQSGTTGPSTVFRRTSARQSSKDPSELKIIWRADDFSLDAALATVRSAELRLREFDIGHNGAERIDEMRCLVRRKRLPEDHSVPAGLMELT